MLIIKKIVIFLKKKSTEIVHSILFFPIIYRQFVKIFQVTAKNGRGSEYCLQKGFLPLRVHYYSPVPDIHDLKKRNVWEIRSELKGIDFRVEKQIELIQNLGKKYSEECRWPLLSTDNRAEFFLQNPSFSYGCAASTHCMIREFKPETIIEIGSGMSSIIISKAISTNNKQNNIHHEYVIIDPFQAEIIRDKKIEYNTLIKERVELVELDTFNRLKKDDILFIDSGHCVRIGGDVNYLFLEVLPRLKPGVIVHIHDISLPYEYSKSYSTNESFRQFWTEQYLLQSFLCFNNEFEILLAMAFIMNDKSKIFQNSFPHFNLDTNNLISGSFWIRRKNK